MQNRATPGEGGQHTHFQFAVSRAAKYVCLHTDDPHGSACHLLHKQCTSLLKSTDVCLRFSSLFDLSLSSFLLFPNSSTQQKKTWQRWKSLKRDICWTEQGLQSLAAKFSMQIRISRRISWPKCIYVPTRRVEMRSDFMLEVISLIYLSIIFSINIYSTPGHRGTFLLQNVVTSAVLFWTDFERKGAKQYWRWSFFPFRSLYLQNLFPYPTQTQIWSDREQKQGKCSFFQSKFRQL